MTEKDYKPKHPGKSPLEVKQKQELKPIKIESKPEKAESKAGIPDNKTEKAEDKNISAGGEDKKSDAKDSKAKKEEIKKKEEALARGLNLHASKKHCMYISDFIKGKPIDQAIKELQEVIAMKRAIPFKGEIPHRKGNMMSGRFPVKASIQIINVLKALKGNSIVNGLDLERTRITFASANWASRPAKKGGMRFKRAQILLKAREMGGKK